MRNRAKDINLHFELWDLRIELSIKNLQETQAGRHVGISHEKAEKHASFFYYIESQPLVEQRDTKCCLSEASSLSNWKNLCACLWAQDADVSFCFVFLPRRKMKGYNKTDWTIEQMISTYTLNVEFWTLNFCSNELILLVSPRKI